MVADNQELFAQSLYEVNIFAIFDNGHQWSLPNFMDFNVKKCEIMRITKKQPFISNFFLHNSFLEEVNEFRDLGITNDQQLRWNLHIDKVVAKANRILGLIKRICRDFDDHKTLRTLYCALVRSNLEYCSRIWSPYAKNCIEKLEKVQRRANKFILKTGDTYACRLNKSGV